VKQKIPDLRVRMHSRRVLKTGNYPVWTNRLKHPWHKPGALYIHR